MPLKGAQVLRALAQGATLKAHRTLDGSKIHQLHPRQSAAVVIPSKVVRALEKQGWVRSNMKFPVATYLLTITGWQIVQRLPK